MTPDQVKRAQNPKRGDTFKLGDNEITVVSFDGYMVECVMNMTWKTYRHQWIIEEWRKAVSASTRMEFTAKD